LELEERVGVGPAAYVEEVLRRVRRALGESMVGAWLVGSAALGDFAPERSDVDIQAIASERLPLRERADLAEALSHEALPCPAKGLEFVLYPRDELEGQEGPAFQLNLNTGERLEYHLEFQADQDPRFWFVIDVSIARQHAVVLAGPPTSRAFPDLPRPLVVHALLEALDWYEAHGPGDALASACRAWAWASDGVWRSKSDAARWARGRLDGSAEFGPVLEAARATLRD
jgi:hypothetical protein